MVALAEGSVPETTVYLTGGATAVLLGWRATTIDVDIRIDPETDDLLRRIPALKETLDLNVELASPLDFLPPLPGWRDRSPFIVQHGGVTYRHFDPYSQALSKVERGHQQDQADVTAMLERGLVDPESAIKLFEAIASELFRFPAIDPETLRRDVDEAFGSP